MPSALSDKDAWISVLDSYFASGRDHEYHQAKEAWRELRPLVTIRADEEFRAAAEAVGLDPNCFMKWITLDTRGPGGKPITARYQVVGVDRRRPVNKVKLRSTRDKVSWWDPRLVQRHLPQPDAPVGLVSRRDLDL